MKVGILGSGDVATTLAVGFMKHGHQVTVGTGTPGKLADWAKQNPSGLTGSFADAAAFGEVIVLAVKGNAAAHVLSLAGTANLTAISHRDRFGGELRCGSRRKGHRPA